MFDLLATPSCSAGRQPGTLETRALGCFRLGPDFQAAYALRVGGLYRTQESSAQARGENGAKEPRNDPCSISSNSLQFAS